LAVLAVITVSEYALWVPAFIVVLLTIVAVFLFISGVDYYNIMGRNNGRSIGVYDYEMQEYAKDRGWRKKGFALGVSRILP